MANFKVKKYVYHTLLFSVILAGIGVLFQLIFPKFASPVIPFIIIFFFIITLFSLFVVLRDSNKSNGKHFIAGYLVSRIVKFISILLFLILYMLFSKDDMWKFAGAFIIIYFCYSIFEVITLKKE